MNLENASLLLACLVLVASVNSQPPPHHHGWGPGGSEGPPPHRPGEHRGPPSGPPSGPPPGPPPSHLPACEQFEKDVREKMEAMRKDGKDDSENFHEEQHEMWMYNRTIEAIKEGNIKPDDKCMAQAAEMYGLDNGNKTKEE